MCKIPAARPGIHFAVHQQLNVATQRVHRFVSWRDAVTPGLPAAAVRSVAATCAAAAATAVVAIAALCAAAGAAAATLDHVALPVVVSTALHVVAHLC